MSHNEFIERIEGAVSIAIALKYDDDSNGSLIFGSVDVLLPLASIEPSLETRQNRIRFTFYLF